MAKAKAEKDFQTQANEYATGAMLQRSLEKTR